MCSTIAQRLCLQKGHAPARKGGKNDPLQVNLRWAERIPGTRDLEEPTLMQDSQGSPHGSPQGDLYRECLQPASVQHQSGEALNAWEPLVY